MIWQIQQIFQKFYLVNIKLDPSDYIYFSIYFLCFLLSFFAKKANLPGLRLLRILLFAGLINEMTYEYGKGNHLNSQFTNFLYIPLEYFLLCFFYGKQTKKDWLKKCIWLSIGLYILVWFYYSFFYYHFKTYPSIVYNLGCFFSIIWIVTIIYDLDPIKELPITLLPIFWILCGLLIFYSGVFIYNAVSNTIRKTDEALAENLRIYINVTCNNILYLSWIYAFICSIKMKKYFYL